MKQNKTCPSCSPDPVALVRNVCPLSTGVLQVVFVEPIYHYYMPNIISDANVSMYADDHQGIIAKETTKCGEDTDG